MAIDVSQASNPSVINLLGNGVIYGDIGLQAGDQSTSSRGPHYFEGIINPASLPLGGISSAVARQRACRRWNAEHQCGREPGARRSTADGAAITRSFLRPSRHLERRCRWDVTFELQPAAGGAQPVGSYPQIFVNTANLDGELVADVTTASGLFADSYSWDNVIDANVRNGTFHQCALGGPNAGSVLLKFACSYRCEPERRSLAHPRQIQCGRRPEWN